MGNGIEVRFEYEGMSLVCDDEAFARLREIIGAEVAVADAIGRRSAAGSVRFISVRMVSDERTPDGPRWIELVPAVFVGFISSVVFIVGVVTIVQWVVRKLG